MFKYIRSGHAWRSPMFHLTDGDMSQFPLSDYRYDEDSGEWKSIPTGDWGERVQTKCGAALVKHRTRRGRILATAPFSLVDQLPGGCEICQRCLERVEFDLRRTHHRVTVDREGYHSRSSELMAAINRLGT